MSEENREPLIEHNSSIKQISIRSRQSRVMSQLSNVSQGDPYIYDLPDLANVTQGVMCRLIAVSVVCVIFLAAEIVGGLMAQSLAILSDAAHMFSDMSGFFISIFSIWLGQRPASEKMSFGYHRAEVIGALASIILIWGLTILLFYEATIRVIGEVVVTDPLIMLITAGFGLFCNLVMAKVLHSSPTGGHDHGNIMHQCSGHDHGHNHNHDHGSSQKKKQKQKKSPKKKVYIQQKRSVISENGVSMLVVEQKMETSSDSNSNSSSNKFQPIKEESSENKSQVSQQDHNHSQMCIHQKKPITLEHNHSENCDHDHNELDIPQDPNETVEQKKCCSNNANQGEPFDTKQFQEQQQQQQQQQQQCKGHQNHDDHDDHNDHDDHDHDHDHNHDHDNNHDHDHDHDHNHDHDHDKRQKQKKSSNLSQIGEQDNYNLKAAMIHVIGDILQSIGVLIAALLIYFFGDKKDKDGVMIFTYWQYADPLCTYLFSILVLFTTFGVAKECLRVLMEGTPTGLIMEEFAEQMRAIHRVKEVHDLHIWSLSVGKPAMSAHIVCKENPEYVLKKATKLCREFGIYHSTIQIELFDRQGANDYIKCEHNLHR